MWRWLCALSPQRETLGDSLARHVARAWRAQCGLGPAQGGPDLTFSVTCNSVDETKFAPDDPRRQRTKSAAGFASGKRAARGRVYATKNGGRTGRHRRAAGQGSSRTRTSVRTGQYGQGRVDREQGRS